MPENDQQILLPCQRCKSKPQLAVEITSTEGFWQLSNWEVLLFIMWNKSLLTTLHRVNDEITRSAEAMCYSGCIVSHSTRQHQKRMIDKFVFQHHSAIDTGELDY